VRDLLILGRDKRPPFPTNPKKTFYRVIPRALARGISAVKSKGLKDPLRTSPKRDLKFFGWSWRRGFIPPPLMETPHCVRGDRGRRVCRPVAKSARDDGWVIFLGSLEGVMSNPLNRLRKKFIPPQLVVILTSALCEEESPPFIFLGGVGGGHSPPPLVETPRKINSGRQS